MRSERTFEEVSPCARVIKLMSTPLAAPVQINFIAVIPNGVSFFILPPDPIHLMLSLQFHYSFTRIRGDNRLTDAGFS